MSKALKVGVIGLGFFGGRHARIYADHPAAELIGVCELRSGAGRARRPRNRRARLQ